MCVSDYTYLCVAIHLSLKQTCSCPSDRMEVLIRNMCVCIAGDILFYRVLKNVHEGLVANWVSDLCVQIHIFLYVYIYDLRAHCRRYVFKSRFQTPNYWNAFNLEVALI